MQQVAYAYSAILDQSISVNQWAAGAACVKTSSSGSLAPLLDNGSRVTRECPARLRGALDETYEVHPLHGHLFTFYAKGSAFVAHLSYSTYGPRLIRGLKI
jgi:hypothetical protein